MKPSIKQIQERACQIWEIDMKDLVGPSRMAPLPDIRHLTICACCLADFRYSEIAKEFNRTAKTVRYAAAKLPGQFLVQDLNAFERLKAIL